MRRRLLHKLFGHKWHPYTLGGTPRVLGVRCDRCDDMLWVESGDITSPPHGGISRPIPLHIVPEHDRNWITWEDAE